MPPLRGRSPEAGASRSRPGSSANAPRSGGRSTTPGPSPRPYSPYVLEGTFPELRHEGVLGCSHTGGSTPLGLLREVPQLLAPHAPEPADLRARGCAPPCTGGGRRSSSPRSARPPPRRPGGPRRACHRPLREPLPRRPLSRVSSYPFFVRAGPHQNPPPTRVGCVSWDTKWRKEARARGEGNG